MLSKSSVSQRSRFKGFTLIEILVTITIIAILSTVGLVAYSAVVKQGKDSRRQSDLRSVQSALEQYFADQLFYPSSTDLNALFSSGGSFTSSTGNPSPPANVKTYLRSMPADPDAGQRYRYVTIPSASACDNSSNTTKCSNYCLYAKIENTSSASLPMACDQDKGTYNFALTPP